MPAKPRGNAAQGAARARERLNAPWVHCSRIDNPWARSSPTKEGGRALVMSVEAKGLRLAAGSFVARPAGHLRALTGRTGRATGRGPWQVDPQRSSSGALRLGACLLACRPRAYWEG